MLSPIALLASLSSPKRKQQYNMKFAVAELQNESELIQKQNLEMKPLASSSSGTTLSDLLNPSLAEYPKQCPSIME